MKIHRKKTSSWKKEQNFTVERTQERDRGKNRERKKALTDRAKF